MNYIDLIQQISRYAGILPEQAAVVLQTFLRMRSEERLEVSTDLAKDAAGVILDQENFASNELSRMHRDLTTEGSLPRLANALASPKTDFRPPLTFNIHHPTRPLVFIHIPKTAGTAFYNYLHTHYSDKGFISPQFTGDYANIPSYKPKILLYWGHYYLNGIRPLLPNGVYCTFLRDPVQRVLSHYRSWNSPENLDAAWLNSLPAEELESVRAAQTMSLEEFLETDNPYIRTQVSNFQTTMLSNHRSSSDPYFLSSAMENLRDQFYFLGIVEEFPRSIELFRRMMSSLRDYDLIADQENRSKSVGKKITKAMRKRIEQLNLFDIKLYEYGLELFRKKCSIHLI